MDRFDRARINHLCKQGDGQDNALAVLSSLDLVFMFINIKLAFQNISMFFIMEVILVSKCMSGKFPAIVLAWAQSPNG